MRQCQNAVTPRRKAPSAPPLGELLSVSEAEGVRYDERYALGFTYATVGAAISRPKPRIFDSTWLNGTRLGAPERGAGSPNGLT